MDNRNIPNDMRNFYRQSRGEELKDPIDVITPLNLDEVMEIEDDYISRNNIDDVDHLVDLIRMLLQKAWGDDSPTLVDEYPTNEEQTRMPLPIIIYDYYDRVHSDNTKKMPQLMKTVNIDGENYELLSEWFDCKLQFDILSGTPKDGKILTKRFEIFLKTYIPYFKYIGITNMIFEIEPRVEPLMIQNHEFLRRRLIYKVKFERKYIRREGDYLQHIQIVLKTDNPLDRPLGIPGVHTDFGKT